MDAGAPSPASRFPPMRDTTAVTVRLVYLARLREAFGTSGESLALAATKHPATVSHVLEQLRARGGVWASELAPGRAVRVAVDQEMAGPETALGPNAEVALFPPVTGG